MVNLFVESDGDILDEVLLVWRSFDPVEGYAAGFKDCEGKLLYPDDETKSELRRRVSKTSQRLTEISDVNLRAAAAKLLDSIGVSLNLERPDSQLFTVALAFWYSLLKNEMKKPFMIDLTKRTVKVLQLEYVRWKNQQGFSGEVSKSAVDACGFLSGVIGIVEQENSELAELIVQVRVELSRFRALFPAHNSDNLDELFAFFEERTVHPVRTEGYDEMLAKLYDYGAAAEEILAGSKQMLNEELALIDELLPKLVKHLKLEPSMKLGQIYQLMTRKYDISKHIIKEAQKILRSINKFTDASLQEISGADKIQPEEAPDFLRPVITSGATLALDYAIGKQSIRIYVNSQKNTSWLTLLNVLVHEATHAYHPIILASQQLPTLLRLRTSFATPISEAMAFHRELELFKAAAKAKDSPHHTPTEGGLLAIFDAPRFRLEDDVNSFELETRVWRIMRALRVICDVEVNSGHKTYVEFVRWAITYSGLDREFIHNECFPFLSSPGYTPSYSFCGAQYAALQRDAELKQIFRREFNTRASRIGLWPWTICRKKLHNFTTDPDAPVMA